MLGKFQSYSTNKILLRSMSPLSIRLRTRRMAKVINVAFFILLFDDEVYLAE